MQVWYHTSSVLSLQRQRKVISEFKVSLYYVARFRTARATWRELVLKKEKAEIRNKEEITWNILVFSAWMWSRTGRCQLLWPLKSP